MGVEINRSFDDRKNLKAVISTGLAFLFVFTAFNSASQANESVLEGARLELGSSFTASGYISLSIVYASCAMFNWISPAIVSRLKPNLSMFLGALTYLLVSIFIIYFRLFLVAFIKPVTWVIYLASAILGFGAALIWTAQGVYITTYSTESTLNRSFGLFWIIFQFNGLIGGIYSYVYLSHVPQITSEIRISLYSAFVVFCFVGCMVFFCVPFTDTESPKTSDEPTSATSVSSVAEPDATKPFMSILKLSFDLIQRRKMIALLVASCFTGLNLTFASAVYATSLGRMSVFGNDAKSYIGLVTIFISLGEISGGQISTLNIRSPTIMRFGFLTAFLTFVLACLIIPPEASIHTTTSLAFLQPKTDLIIIIAILAGVTDSLWCTQISSLIGKTYPTDSDPNITAAAFALFKFVQSILSAIAFFYSTVLNLHWQLLILQIFAILGLFGFLYVDRGIVPETPRPSELPVVNQAKSKGF